VTESVALPPGCSHADRRRSRIEACCPGGSTGSHPHDSDSHGSRTRAAKTRARDHTGAGPRADTVRIERRANIGSRAVLRPTIPPGSPRCSLHEPASTSSGPFSTNAPSGADDTDRQAGVSAALRSQEITPYKWVHPNEER
jgi:hypothetical protein